MEIKRRLRRIACKFGFHKHISIRPGEQHCRINEEGEEVKTYTKPVRYCGICFKDLKHKNEVAVP